MTYYIENLKDSIKESIELMNKFCKVAGYKINIQNFVSVQLLSHVWFFVTPWIPCFPVLHYLPSLFKLMFIKSVMPSNHLILCRSLLLLPSVFPASGSFPTSHFFALGGQNTGASDPESVPPKNIQDWFPFGLTGLISLKSKGLSRVFSNITVQNHQFFGIQPSL